MNSKELQNWFDYIFQRGYLNDEFGKYAKLYYMTTENISEYLSKFNLKGKKVLSVASSGDHAFNACLNGARDITLFDINPFSFFIVDLKKASIQAFTYEEFLEFYAIGKNTDFFKRELFNKLYPYLSFETITIMEKLYGMFNNPKEIYNRIFYSFKYNLDHIRRMSNYMNRNNYLHLKRILLNEEINFTYIKSDFKNLIVNLDNNYDLMLFSNISDYIEKMYQDNFLENYKLDIDTLKSYLNKNGEMQFGYIYTHPYQMIYRSVFTYNKKRREVFKPNEVIEKKVLAFDDSYPYQYTDNVISYVRK